MDLECRPRVDDTFSGLSYSGQDDVGGEIPVRVTQCPQQPARRGLAEPRPTAWAAFRLQDSTESI